MKKLNKKLIYVIVYLNILIAIWLILYNYQKEQENIKIDEYNFEQFKKIWNILDKLDKKSYSFNNLKEFNQRFNQDIKPMKNCYFLSSTEDFFWKANYIFLFEIYSKKFNKKYNSTYYIYPESMYNLIEYSLCEKHWGICSADIVFSKYMETISNPCQN